MKTLESCIVPPGTFVYGIHKPSYEVTNLRPGEAIDTLGQTTDGSEVDNSPNYPKNDLTVSNADWIYEIPNPFFFRGRTYIDKEWADSSANNPAKISLKIPETVSLSKILAENQLTNSFIAKLPSSLQLALATTSTDKEDLIQLAHISCKLIRYSGDKLGLNYEVDQNGRKRAIIHDHDLFEAIANNPYLPDEYKIAMVIRPGAQGGSEIVGEWPQDGNTHVYEYLRRNSYIAGGHYAANMAEDAIRYSTAALTRVDMQALRHLYYQRTYVRFAGELGIPQNPVSEIFRDDELEDLRLKILDKIENSSTGPATLWGWNYGFDYAPSRYRLHASHQQIHQQYAIVPAEVEAFQVGCHDSKGRISSFCCGDLIAEVIERYHLEHKRDFFTDYLQAISSNSRMDEREDLENDLVVWCDKHAMLFVPKAQTSQWELQLMTLPGKKGNLSGNIIECTTEQRASLDAGLFFAQKSLAGLGVKMVTSIEYSKRINKAENTQQPLIYSLLPRLPESPGAFSEAQLRFINGHYPEDFASACRKALQ